MKTLTFEPSEKSASLARNYGYDEWLVGRFMRYVPQVEDFLSKMEKKPTTYIRVNTLKTIAPGLKSRLESKGFELEHTVLPDVLSVKKAPLPIGATTEYMLGLYYIQDLSSCIAVEALDVAENQTVLDMAAAPGGKTTFIAQKMKNTGAVVALETSERRARSMSFNLSRCGVINTAVFKMDAKDAGVLQAKFDRVLLDAPCSCEGVISKDVTRKTSHTPQDVDYCASLQVKLIDTASRMVKPGGILVYSTCSFAPEENEFIVNWLLHNRQVRIEPVPYGSEGLTEFGGISFDASLGNARRLYPHIHDTLGFFIAKMRVGDA